MRLASQTQGTYSTAQGRTSVEGTHRAFDNVNMTRTLFALRPLTRPKTQLSKHTKLLVDYML